MALNPIVITVSIVIQLNGGSVIGSATGFFYTYDGELFLVTNKHVVTGSPQTGKPDTLRLRLHLDPNDISKNDDLDIPLYENKKPAWKTHPTHPDADVALIKLDKKAVEGKFFIKAWSGDDFLPDNYRLDPGEDVFIMGYPLSFHDRYHNLPIFRNAMLASTYRVHFEKQPFVLTDANLHPGTSGSPVITKPKNTWVDDAGNTNLTTGTVYYLIGVHSGTIDPKMTGGQKIGLGAAWYAKLVEDIAALF